MYCQNNVHLPLGSIIGLLATFLKYETVSTTHPWQPASTGGHYCAIILLYRHLINDIALEGKWRDTVVTCGCYSMHGI